MLFSLPCTVDKVPVYKLQIRILWGCRLCVYICRMFTQYSGSNLFSLSDNRPCNLVGFGTKENTSGSCSWYSVTVKTLRVQVNLSEFWNVQLSNWLPKQHRNTCLVKCLLIIRRNAENIAHNGAKNLSLKMAFIRRIFYAQT